MPFTSSKLFRSLFLAGVTAALSACPNGVDDDDAGVTEDAGTHSDGGTGTDGGPGTDGGGNTDGGEPDAGQPTDGGSNTDAGTTEPDAGPEPFCPVEDLCGNVAVSEGVRFEAGPSSTNLFGPEGAANLVIGEATRADVEAAFGTPLAGDNPFRAWYCAYGVRVEYVDDLSGDVFEGNGSPYDVVARVVTLPGVQLSSGFGVTPGQTRAAAQAALTSPVSVDLESTSFDASASDGLSVVSSDGVVTSVALFKPQSAAGWNVPVDPAVAALGQGPSRIAIGSTLASADALLGTSWDVQGRVDFNQFLRVMVRSYVAFGIRIVASCPLAGPCAANNANIQQIALSPPFVGATSQGIRLGSSEADVVQVYGAGTPSQDNENLLVYDLGNNDLGIAFVTDTSCVRRVAGLVLGYRELGGFGN